MVSITRSRRMGALLLAVAVVFVPALGAQSAGEADFYRAYYLEHAEGRSEAAFALYRAVANDAGVEESLRAEAARRAEGLAEDLAASDFARLVPYDTIFYAELSHPGEQLESLLAQLGLLGRVQGDDPEAFGISPLLVQGALGMRGAAVAVTAVELQGGMPNGVLILHPGDLELVRGMIETALPAGGATAPAIEGYPTWKLERQIYVTLTSRLVIASPDPAQIEGVLGRLAGDDDDSLADNPNVRAALAARGDGLLTFCLNAQPVLPMVRWMIEQETRRDPEAAMALSFVDLDSLRCVSGHVGVDEAGLDLEVALELAEGHRNLVFNLLRNQPVGTETLHLVPRGAAFFLAEAYNPTGPVAPILKDSAGQPVVSFMDFGRELFGNLVDVAIFGLPADDEGGGPIPDVAAVIRSNDTERTQAVLGLLLDMATQGSSSGRLHPEPTEIAGVEAVQYNLGGVPLFVAAEGGRLIVSPSRGAVAQSIDAANGRGSVLEDPLFADALDGLAEGTTFVLMASAGRCASLAAPFLSPREAAEIEPYLGMIEDTVVAMDLEHSETRLALRTRLRGVPDLGPVVVQALRARQGRGAGTRRAVLRVEHSPEPAAALAATPEREAAPSLADVRAQFDALAAKEGAEEEAEAVGRALMEAAGKDHFFLNNFSWALLTEERYAHRFDTLALEAARRSNELTAFENWIYLDTLAHALFFRGETDQAIELERRAVERAGSDVRRGEAEAALQRFLAAASPNPERAAAPPPGNESESAEAGAGRETATEARVSAEAPDAAGRRRAFEALARAGGTPRELERLGRGVLEAAGEDADFLNEFAWSLLTEEGFARRFDDLALDVAMRSNKLTKFGNWLYVDTLAHAVFFNGDREGAIDLEKMAIELAKGDPRIGEAEAALQRFQAAREEDPKKDVAPVETPPEPPAVEPPAVESAAVESAAPESACTPAPAPDPVALRGEFEALVRDGAEHAEVMAVGARILAAAREEEAFLNAFAWELLTDEVYGNEFDDLALDLALRANQLARFQNWYFVDTLARAVFQSGDLEGAIGLEETALELAGSDERRGEAETALARYRTALEERTR